MMIFGRCFEVRLLTYVSILVRNKCKKYPNPKGNAVRLEAHPEEQPAQQSSQGHGSPHVKFCRQYVLVVQCRVSRFRAVHRLILSAMSLPPILTTAIS
jgi:hypothetical protein